MRSGSEDERGGKPTHSAKIVILEKERKKTVICFNIFSRDVCMSSPLPFIEEGMRKRGRRISHITVV